MPFLPAPPPTASQPRPRLRLILACLSLPLLALVSLLLGAGDISPASALQTLLGVSADAQQQTVLFEMRLPRLFAALLTGAALGVAGLLMQALTRNPLAEPGLLGVNAGAALGVVLGICFAGIASAMGYLLCAAAGAVVGNAAVLWFARQAEHGAAQVQQAGLRLVLAGVGLGASFQGLSASLLLQQAAAYDQYRFWLLGSLAAANPAMLQLAAPLILAALLLALVLARPLSALLLGDDAARALGHSPAKLRNAVVLCSTLLCGAAVALAGPVAFLGLLAPFIARAVWPHGLGQQILLCAWLGASLMLVADLAARLYAAPFETPLSVMTAMLGAPLLIWLARQPQRLEALGGRA